jgi:hypothetical protein
MAAAGGTSIGKAVLSRPVKTAHFLKAQSIDGRQQSRQAKGIVFPA